eukprot:8033322-Heterocapsa_arctica.AAC.1
MQCRRCQKMGHYAKDCRAPRPVVATVYETEPPLVSGLSMEGASVMGLEVAAISPYFPQLQSVLRLIDPMMFLMDSGAFAH